MRYFNYLPECDQTSLFYCQPTSFDKMTEREILRDTLGGLLYIPGSNPSIAKIVLTDKVRGLSSLAICLEDAIGEQEQEEAVKNTQRQLSIILEALSNGSLPKDRLPLIFVRVKDAEMLEHMANLFVQYHDVLTGVILPKVSRGWLDKALHMIDDIGTRSGVPFYAMPTLETEELMLSHNRIELLHEMKRIIDRHYTQVLNIRVGATDLCGLYGIRRRADTPIYQITTVASCITDVVRVFGLKDRYTVSGPVWEYYSTAIRSCALQDWSEIAGLLQEVYLDKQNGFCGKTCVHPTQLLPVQASYAVPYEIYQDACAIIGKGADCQGVLPSARQNKMNEVRPHALWARKILRQSSIYGVFQEGTDAKGFLRAVHSGAFSI